MPLVVDVHRADRGDPAQAHHLVEVGAAYAESVGGLVGAEGDVAIEEGGQVAAAGKRGHLVGVDVGVGPLAPEVGQQAGADEMADGGRGHPRPEPQRLAQRFGQPVRRPRCSGRTAQGRADRLRIGRLHHRPGPQTGSRVGGRDQA
ncbi:hypothetical protein [Streptomyces sp. NPDC057494]|uniref:hypothetical protein n=1 Tax=Streptomyces sp. NPDC057494 TaxID=3346148 RepID=UPI0036AB55E7